MYPKILHLNNFVEKIKTDSSINPLLSLFATGGIS
jgi:hypothetical protein